jgi:hypothetical protein
LTSVSINGEIEVLAIYGNGNEYQSRLMKAVAVQAQAQDMWTLLVKLKKIPAYLLMFGTGISR